MKPQWTIDDFEFFEQLGKGRLGIVYRAKEKASRQVVALKMIPKAELNTAQKRRQIKLEVEVHSRLKHPGICQLYGYFQTQRHLFLVLEYCGDNTLFSIVMQGDQLLPESEISGIMKMLLSAVAYMSERHVMHRDLKLENVVMKAGCPKIIDFGCCVHTFGPRRTLCGTTEYLCPEMVLGNEYDSRVDVYTLGVLLYELLFQKSPFFEIDEKEMLRNIKEGVLLFEGPRKDASQTAKDLVSQMLIQQCTKRPSAKLLLEHPYVRCRQLLQSLQQPDPEEPLEVRKSLQDQLCLPSEKMELSELGQARPQERPCEQMEF